MDKIEGSVLRSPADVRGFADFDGPLYYVPTGFIDRSDDPQTLPLAGGNAGFRRWRLSGVWMMVVRKA